VRREILAMWRLARAEEDDSIVALCMALYAEDPATVEVGAQQVRRTLEALRAEPVRGRVLVLDDGGALRGYALLISYWSNELGGELCQLDEVYVAPAARGRGHARALVEGLARGDGPWPLRPVALQLEVSPSNARARALYERLAFEPLRNACMRRRLPR
jgi:ribosomal protein S18 acetylase RimI-like enzyme